MSIYAGLSLREIYVKRCKELRCKPNSEIKSALSDKPDDFNSITFIDVSKNFVGPKGILPLLGVIQCAQRIHTLDLREQKLTNEVVQKLCHALLSHPSITRINLSDNPLTITAGTYLLELVTRNRNIEFIGLDNTTVRQAVMDRVNTRTEQNTEAKQKRKSILKDTAERSIGGREGKPDKRVSLLALKPILSTLSSSVHPFLFDENPLDDVAQVCFSQSAWFYDVQFPPDDESRHMEVTRRYGSSRWKRLSEMYKRVKVVPDPQEPAEELFCEPFIALPTNIRSGFSWVSACAAAAFSTVEDIKQAIFWPEVPYTSLLGLYVVRCHVDGAWRYVLVDDFIPVDLQDNPLFTPPVFGEAAVFIWPCLLEKALAKLHGGYQALDALHDPEGDTLPPGPQQEAKKLLAAIQGVPASCARTLADFTGGIPVMKRIHGNPSRGGFDATEWWDILETLIGKGNRSLALARSRGGGQGLQGIEPDHTYQVVQTLQMNGVRIVELVNHAPDDVSVGWRGEWSEVSNTWSQFPDVEEQVYSLQERSKRRTTMAPLSTEGGKEDSKSIMRPNMGSRHNTTPKPSFWLSYANFLQGFQEIHLCRLFPLSYMERKVEGEWNHQSSGGPLWAPSWFRNPHYHLQVIGQTFLFLSLCLPDSRFVESDASAIGFDILEDDYFPLAASETERESKVLFSTGYRTADAVSFESVLAPSDVYWIIPSCSEVGVLSPFTFRIFSEGSFSLTRESMEDFYAMAQASVEVPSSGPFKFGEGNAQVAVMIGALRFTQPISTHSPLQEDDSHTEYAGSESRLSRRSKSNVSTPHPSPGGLGLDERPESRLVVRACCRSRSNARSPTNESLAVFLNEGVSVFADDGTTTPERALGSLDKRLCAESPHVRGHTAYLTHSPVLTYDSFTATCTPQPIGSSATVDFTVWVSAPLQVKVIPLPYWQKSYFPIEWTEGSCSYYETSTVQPQLEVFPEERYERMVIRMDLEESSVPFPALMLTVLANGQLGEPIRGRIPREHIITQSEYATERWVQCELSVPVDDEVESFLVIPCLQPVGTTGKCIITVSRKTEVKGRVLNQR